MESQSASSLGFRTNPPPSPTRWRSVFGVRSAAEPSGRAPGRLSTVAHAWRKRSFACDACGKPSGQSSQLTRHQRTHTGERPYHTPCAARASASGPTSRGTSASTPGSGHSTLNARLGRHQHTHTDEKPHPRPERGKAFSRRGNLLQPRLTHTGERPYVCPRGGRALASGPTSRSPGARTAESGLRGRPVRERLPLELPAGPATSASTPARSLSAARSSQGLGSTLRRAHLPARPVRQRFCRGPSGRTAGRSLPRPGARSCPRPAGPQPQAAPGAPPSAEPSPGRPAGGRRG